MRAIEVADLPDDAYKTLCSRAQRAGKSIEAYTRDELIALASQPTKHEAIEQIEEILRLSNLPSPSIESILEDLDADRH